MVKNIFSSRKTLDDVISCVIKKKKENSFSLCFLLLAFTQEMEVVQGWVLVFCLAVTALLVLPNCLYNQEKHKEQVVCQEECWELFQR